MEKQKVIGILGGDKRQEYMVQLLKDQGFSVLTYAVTGQEYSSGTRKELINNSDVLIAPIPFTRNQKTLASIMEKEDLDIDGFLSCLKAGHILCGGNFPEKVCNRCKELHIPVYDFLKDGSIAAFNAIPTAEGALMEACRLSPLHFYHNKSIVIGYGKCGSVLADRLKGMHSDVFVCARRREARTQAQVLGFKAISFEELRENLKNAVFIFNTVPAPILSKEDLECLSPLAVIVDIASAPGGIDYHAAGALGITSSLYLSIPGKTAPYSAAKILTNALTDYLKTGMKLSAENKPES